MISKRAAIVASLFAASACVDTDAGLEPFTEQIVGTVTYSGEVAYSFSRPGLVIQVEVVPFVSLAHGLVLEEIELAPRGQTTVVPYTLSALAPFEYHLRGTLVDLSTYTLSSVVPAGSPFGGFPDPCEFLNTTVTVTEDGVVEADFTVFDDGQSGGGCSSDPCPAAGTTTVRFNVVSETLEVTDNDGFFAALFPPNSTLPAASASALLSAEDRFPLDPAPVLPSVALNGQTEFFSVFCYDRGFDFSSTRACDQGGDVFVRSDSPLMLTPDTITQVNVDLDAQTSSVTVLDLETVGCE